MIELINFMFESSFDLYLSLIEVDHLICVFGMSRLWLELYEDLSRGFITFNLS